MILFGIYHLLSLLVACYMMFFGLFTIIVSPWFINRKFRSEWKDFIQKKTFYVASDINPYGVYMRTQMYAQAATSEKYAQKTFGVSRNEFRSKLNWFQLSLCYIALSILPALIWILIYYFFAHTMGYENLFDAQMRKLPGLWLNR